MHRIYFDENARDERGRYDLGLPGSLQDIGPIAAQLTNGMRVILYDTEELEIEAVLEYDENYKRWMAVALADS